MSENRCTPASQTLSLTLEKNVLNPVFHGV